MNMVDLNAEQLAEWVAKSQAVSAQMQTTKDSIMSLVSSNKSALLALCAKPEFVSMCRKQYALPSTMQDGDVREYIRHRLFDSDKPVKAPPTTHNVTASPAKRGAGQTTGRSSQSYQAPPPHYIKVVNKQLTTWGYRWNEKTASVYSWLTPLEYIDTWGTPLPGKYCRKDGNNYDIYAIRIHYPSGQEFEIVNKKIAMRSEEGVLSEVYDGSEFFGLRAFTGIFVFRALVNVLYELYGDAVIKKLGDFLFASRMKMAGSSELYAKFMVFESELLAGGAKSIDGHNYLQLPGVYVSGDVTDKLLLNYKGLKDLRQYSDGTTLFWEFNNPCYYTQLFLDIACSISEEPDDITEKRMCETVQYLTRPDMYTNQ